jgi:hypothetical protein
VVPVLIGGLLSCLGLLRELLPAKDVPDEEVIT